MKLYKFLRKHLKRIFTWALRLEISGEENLPKDKAVIVCSNHISNWDPIVLAAVFERPVRFMAKASLFKIPLLNTLIRTLGAFPVNRGSADPASLKTAINTLKNGDAVGVFPQGTRCMNQEPSQTEIKSGVGMIAYRSGADVIPVSIKTKNYKMKLFRKVYVKVGKVIPNAELNISSSAKSEYESASRLIFDRILGLL